jgi:hypothetical protein
MALVTHPDARNGLRLVMRGPVLTSLGFYSYAIYMCMPRFRRL